MTEAGIEIPDLIPARMVNEGTYCPRLFYLEWVQSRFEDNADTVDGRYQHRVVDAGGGRAPEPGDGEVPKVARSVLLSSPRLGLIGRVDLLEGEGGEVVPVDYKRGSAPGVDSGAWEPERMQVAALALLARDNGYRCSRGVLWFVESRERIEVLLDDELVERVIQLTSELRRLARLPEAPPPLVNSPKCPRCSLVGICLPDEHNALLSRSRRQPRRLTPRDDLGRPLYVTEPGATVGVRDGRFEVRAAAGRGDQNGRPRRGELLASVRPIDVSQVCTYGNVQITTQALVDCFALDIPVLWFSHGGWLRGVADGMPSKNVDLRRRQVALASQGGIDAVRGLVSGKIRNCRVLLRRNGRPAPPDTLASLLRLAESAETAESAPSLLGIEGAAARLYFQALPTMLRPEVSLPGRPFSFEGRNRRPPADPTNCLLSFVYALLVKDLVATTLSVGFDPYLGFYHRPRFGRPALALDLAEEFRPLVGDSVVINLINNGEIRPSHFTVRAGGVSLTADGRRAVMTAYERRLEIEVTHPVFGYRITYRRVLEVQSRLLAAWVLGEIPDYVPFTTR